MGTFARLLRDGVRLAALRRPLSTPFDTGFASFALLLLAEMAIDAGWQFALVDAPRRFELWALQSALSAGLIRLACVALLVLATRRRPLFWAAAAWLEAALCVVSALTGPLYAIDRHVEVPLGYWTWFAGLAWLLLIFLRLALHLGVDAKLRAAAAAIVAFALHTGPWLVMPSVQFWSTVQDEPFDSAPEPGLLAHPEAAMYAQDALLDRALEALAPERPGRSDLYAVLFAGDAGEDVFRNEAEYAQRLLESRAGAAGHVLALVNHPDRARSRPLATATNLERALQRVAERMNVEEDIFFLYLTSHGSPDHRLYVNQPPLPLDQLTPRRLRRALDRAGLRWRVLVVSACYSGGWIDDLRDARTLVITAARADRSSFGCGADSDITWFGEAFLAQALNRTVDFVAAFADAKATIETWERQEEFEASEPQIEQGAQIGAKLEQWRAGFTPGPRVEFKPADE
jgi:hypothetical protein